jgi:hypothetical protein
MVTFGYGTQETNPTDVKDYKSAEVYLQRGRSKDYRPLQWKTILRRTEDGSIAVKYHDTDVVIYHEDGSITLNSGGWKTQTTKRRMNDYTEDIGGDVYADKGVWYIGEFWGRFGKGHVYQDGMTINPDGTVDYHGDAPNEKELIKLRKSIAKYAKDFAENLPGIGLPDSGDCWFCYMQFDGEETSDTSHLLSHIEEGYYVPSLAFRAIKESGWGDYFGYTIQELMRDGESWGRSEHWKSVMARHIRKFIQKRLGLSVG